jgi:glycosyltransferase involved in cell wall biosynthesis
VPKITVVIPNYNHGRYIGETIDHIVRQTFEDWELVVVDDGSTDDSLDVLSRYQPRVQVIRAGHHGPAAARNRAIEATDSEYIAFMDADDLCEAGKFELQMRRLEGEQLDLVASALSFIDAMGWPIPGLWASPPNARNGYWASLLERNWIGTPSVMLRRSVLETTGLFDTQFSHAEDYDLWLRIGRAHSIGYIEAPLVQCRRHAGNTSIDIDSHQRFERIALQKVDPDSARQAFGRLYPGQQERDAAWVWFLLRSGNPAFGQEAHAALARNPHSTSVRFALGVFHYDSGDYEKSRTTFMGIREQDAASTNNAGVISVLCGDLEDARMRFIAALRLREGYYDARHNLDALKSGGKLTLTRRPLRANLVPMRERARKG